MNDTELEKRLRELENNQKALLKKFTPVSAQRLDKVYVAIKETMDNFSVQLAEQQELRRRQNDKITTLTQEVQDLKKQVVMLSAMTQTGRPVDKVG